MEYQIKGWNFFLEKIMKMQFQICMIADFIQCTEVHFNSLLSGGFTTMTVINPQIHEMEYRIKVQDGIFFLIKYENVGPNMIADFIQCTEVQLDSFLSSGFTTMTVINPPDWKLTNRTFMQCEKSNAHP